MIKYFNFEGRISGKQFAIRYCVIFLIGFGLTALFTMYFFRVPEFSKDIFGVLAAVTVLLTMVAHTSNVVKRCHDLDLSTFLGIIIVLIIVILVVLAITIDKNLGRAIGVLSAIVLVIKKGTKGPNKYGPDPLQKDTCKEISASNLTNPAAVDTRDLKTTLMDGNGQSDVQKLIQASAEVYNDNAVPVNTKTEKSSASEENKLISESNNYKQSTLTLGDLKKLKQLLDDGIITQEDFNAVKKEILG